MSPSVTRSTSSSRLAIRAPRYVLTTAAVVGRSGGGDGGGLVGGASRSDLMITVEVDEAPRHSTWPQRSTPARSRSFGRPGSPPQRRRRAGECAVSRRCRAVTGGVVGALARVRGRPRPDVELQVVRDRRAALDAAPHVLVLDARTAWLTQAFVGEAEQVGVRFVGVYDRSDGGASRDRWPVSASLTCSRRRCHRRT
jgi:hypothetical protein